MKCGERSEIVKKERKRKKKDLLTASESANPLLVLKKMTARFY